MVLARTYKRLQIIPILWVAGKVGVHFLGRLAIQPNQQRIRRPSTIELKKNELTQVKTMFQNISERSRCGRMGFRYLGGLESPYQCA